MQLIKLHNCILIFLILNLPDSVFSQAGKQLIVTGIKNDSLVIAKKASTQLSNLLLQKSKTAKYRFVVSLTGANQLEKFLTTHQPNIVVIKTDLPSASVLLECSAEYLLKSLLADTSILFADKYEPPHTEAGVIGYNRHFHGINMVDYAIPGANGKGIVVSVKEQKMDSSDLDLYKRVRVSTLSGGNIEPHATSIASLIGGAGNSFYNGRGIANGCTFYSSSFANLFADDGAVLAQNKVTIQNHSYGTIVQQFYGAEAVSYDAQCWQNKNLLHVFSAGNRGTSSATDGPYAGIANYANLTGNFKLAKNVVAVAAIDDKGNISPLSSVGPAYDGRLVPQITALGANGTSDAAAIVSGTAAVMQQVYSDSNAQQIPTAALIKAVLYNTADDIHRTGIDYKTGFGLLNSYEAVKAIQQKKYDGGVIAQSQVWQKDITVPPSALFKITLAWTDTTSPVNNTKALINDLDLEVEELSTNVIYKPWVLSSVARLDSLEKLPFRKRDSLNTAEQVSISLPNTGNYRIRVIGAAVVNNSIPFSIAFGVDTINTFSFTNPRHTSDINRQENATVPIRWKTAVADTNSTGTLSVSYDNAATWQTLQSNFKIYKRVYNWDSKDTASMVQFRMQTSFGSFLSQQVIISPVIRPQVDFLCTDSFRLSWDKHIYAAGYDIYALTDSPYLKKVRSVTDSFAVFTKTAYPHAVYAIQPVLQNQLPASRSVAVNINLQSVNCFYKALNYTQLDSNSIRLSLELSTTANVDSISFERITASGSLFQTYGSRKITGNGLVHNQLADNIPAGLQYFRAKIKLNNGAIVYSDVVTIISSGQNSLWVYPNPIRSNGTLNYFLRNQGRYFRLQLLTTAGHLIKSWEVAFSGTINLPLLSAGIYLLRLVDDTGKPAGATKLIIQ